VFHTIGKIADYSDGIRQKVLTGEVALFGGVFDILEGAVHWLGPHPNLEKVLGVAMPLHKWKTSPFYHPVSPKLGRNPGAVKVLQMLQLGNERFYTASPQVRLPGNGANPNQMSADAIVLAPTEVGLSVETVFDVLPGDVVVQRSMGNIAGHPGGTLFTSLEYAVTKFKPKILLIVGASDSNIVDMAFDMLSGEHLATPTHRVILDRVLVSALRAFEQVSKDVALTAAGRDMKKKQLAVDLNTLYTAERLLESDVIAQAIRDGSLEVHAAVLDRMTGKVDFLGEHPMQEEMVGPLINMNEEEEEEEEDKEDKEDKGEEQGTPPP